MGKVSRKSASSQIWDKFVGPGRDTLPFTHHPINKIILQRYRGFRNTAGNAGKCYTKTHFTKLVGMKLKKFGMKHAFSFWWWGIENDCESENKEEPTSDESDWEEPQPAAKKMKRSDTITVDMNL